MSPVENFSLRRLNDSNSLGERYLVVQWEKLQLAGDPASELTFQVHLYETGQVTYGGLGLKSTPIIDYRGYVDAPENPEENHARFHSFSMRARSTAKAILVPSGDQAGSHAWPLDPAHRLIAPVARSRTWMA